MKTAWATILLLVNASCSSTITPTTPGPSLDVPVKWWRLDGSTATLLGPTPGDDLPIGFCNNSASPPPDASPCYVTSGAGYQAIRNLISDLKEQLEFAQKNQK